jgi:hypothetical protein
MKSPLVQALFLASSLFLIELGIKGIAFNSDTLFIDIYPSISLWITALYFTLSISEQDKFNATATPRLSKKSSGDGIEITYDVRLPENLDSTPKYLFMFIISVAIWIFTVLLSQKSLTFWVTDKAYSCRIIIFILINQFLTCFNIGSAYRVIKASYNA